MRDDSAENPESTASSLHTDCRNGSTAAKTSSPANTTRIRFISSSNSSRNWLFAQNPEQYKVPDQWISRPLPVIRLDRIHDSQNQIKHPSTNCPKPDHSKSAEKRQGRWLAGAARWVGGNRRKHKDEHDDDSQKTGQRKRRVPDQHLQRMKRYKARILFQQINHQRRDKTGKKSPVRGPASPSFVHPAWVPEEGVRAMWP